MFGWVRKKSENSRVYMCVKELKWELEAASQVKRAKILALSQLIRTLSMDSLEGALENPFEYQREDIVFIYNDLEDLRNGMTGQLKHLEKSFKNLGIDFPDDWKNHVKLTQRAVEVWMTLIGCGMAPDSRDDVRKIWQYLNDSKPSLLLALQELRATSAMQAEFTGTDLFSEFGHSDEMWLKLCQASTDRFSKSLF